MGWRYIWVRGALKTWNKVPQSRHGTKYLKQDMEPGTLKGTSILCLKLPTAAPGSAWFRELKIPRLISAQNIWFEAKGG